MKVKFFSDLSDPNSYFQLVDFVSDVVDLGVDSYHSTIDSPSVRESLDRCGTQGPYTFVDGDVMSNNIQYVTVALENPEDAVKIRLMMDEINTNKQYSKEYFIC